MSQQEQVVKKKAVAPSSPPPDPAKNIAASVPIDDPSKRGTVPPVPPNSNPPNPPRPSSEPTSYRAGMEREDSSAKGHLAEPLITINPKDIDAQTRIPSVIAMATHETIGAWAKADSEPEHITKEKVSFQVNTLSGIMGLWEFSYEKKAISLDGKARQEYVDVSKLEAIGPTEDSMLAQSVLNEGAKQLSNKDKRTK